MWNLRPIGVAALVLGWIVGPLLALLVLLAWVQAVAAQVERPETGPSTAPATEPATRPAPTTTATATAPAAKPEGLGPLLMAGDRYFIWLLQPKMIGEQGDRTRGYSLAVHAAGLRDKTQDKWRAVVVDESNSFYGGAAALSAVSSDPGGQPEPRLYDFTTANVFHENGSFTAYSRNARTAKPNLPGTARPVAATEIWVLALGRPPVASRTASTATGSAPASATAPAGARGGDLWLVYKFEQGNWRMLAPLGRAGGPGMPSAQARPVLAHQGKLLWLAWFEPGAPGRLCARVFDGGADTPGWLPLATSDLPSALAPMTRLQAVVIDPAVYVFWAQPRTGGMELCGVALDPDGKVDAGRHVPTMDISAIAAGVDPVRDVAVARESNSLMVVAQKEGRLQSLLLDISTGRALREPASLEPQGPSSRDTIILQNIALVILAALMALSLWQWRAKPMVAKLAPGMRVGRISERLIAGVIDLAIPLAAVTIVFGLYQEGRLAVLMGRWVDAIWRPQVWWEVPEMRWLMAGYLAHVTVGELLTGRSIGKAIMGLRVVAMDSTRAGPLQILLRNLVRVPEMATVILLAYLLINEYRQRIGDLLARTMVVHPAEEAGSRNDE